MAEIDFGIPLKATNGETSLDEIILHPQIMAKPDGSPFRVRFDGPEHILTIGPTRSGKGRRLLAPELVYDTDRSIVVIDPKGELAKWTAEHRAKKGSEVYAIDPFGVLAKMPRLGLTSIGFNPMRGLNPDGDDYIDDCVSIAEAICPIESQKDPHFEQGGQEFIAGLVMYRRMIDPNANLADIRRDLGRTPKEWKNLIYGDDNGKTAEGKDSVFLLSKLKAPVLWVKLGALGEISPEDRELNAFIRSAKTKTQFLDSPPIGRDLAKPGIDFRTLKDKSVTVYLVLPPVRLVTHAKWLRLVIAGAIEALRKTERNANRPDTLFILDEFPQLGRMKEVETGVQLNAGYGIKFWVVIQNITQLQTLYEDNWETFTSAGVLTSYAPRDPTTSEYLAKISGERTIEVRGHSRDQSGSTSTSINRQRRENVMPHQFRQMGKGMMFVRLPSEKSGESLFITQADDFTQRKDVPAEVRERGK